MSTQIRELVRSKALGYDLEAIVERGQIKTFVIERHVGGLVHTSLEAVLLPARPKVASSGEFRSAALTTAAGA